MGKTYLQGVVEGIGTRLTRIESFFDSIQIKIIGALVAAGLAVLVGIVNTIILVLIMNGSGGKVR
jgi:phage shock protein PspC (stress-responsive transcriptional regulator)